MTLLPAPYVFREFPFRALADARMKCFLCNPPLRQMQKCIWYEQL